MSFSQENRMLSIETPLGPDVFALTSFRGREGISVPFSFELTLVSEDTSIDPRALIGKGATVFVRLAQDETRPINGVISRFRQERLGVPEGPERLMHMATYTAVLVPWTWLLSKSMNSRIFQKKDVVQIVEQVFGEWKFSHYEFRLTGSYAKREYCVQYHESDLDFVSRLLEEEGIFYFFEHERSRHVLVMADSPDAHRDCPVQSTVRCLLDKGAEAVQAEDVITHLGWGEEIRIASYVTTDYNYLMPSTDLLVEMPTSIEVGTGKREVYDFPGRYGTRADGERYAELRMQAEEAQVTKLHGVGNCRTFSSGYRFTLEDYHRKEMNGRPYVLVDVEHEAREPVELTGSAPEASYTNTFTCIPHGVAFRPLRLTPKPVVQGVQTATVTGPPGEEIYTDEHGRVKVQFPWDREGLRNEETTCFIRVGQVWAGQGWGAVWIPRIGHEVIVGFVEGDPDRPIIIGSVYNAANTPPYTLPDQKTKSTLKSNSTPGGGGSNEIRFEDKKGEEEVYIHAQKDHNVVVEHNRGTTVGNNDSVTVGNDRSLTVRGSETITVTRTCTRTIQQGEKLTVAQGRTVQVTGGESRTIEGGLKVVVDGGVTESVSGSRQADISGACEENIGGKWSVASGGDCVMRVGGNMGADASGGIELQAGSKVTITSGGWVVTVDASGQITASGTSITLNAGGSSVEIGASGISLTTGGMITLTGSMIKNNC